MLSELPLLFGGLALFVYAITQLSEVMSGLFTEKARLSIQRYTSHILASIIIGTLFTILLGSSSAVIILTIVFINARSLTFRQAIGIVMGANIGTSFSSQIIALDVGAYSIFPLFIGLMIDIFSKKQRLRHYGRFLLYFGMLFFGLSIMEGAVLPLKDSPLFTKWMVNIDQNHYQGALVGGLVTLIIQSSSATVGMAIILGKQQIISLAGGIAVMLGAELGTCSDTLIATIKGSRQALKTGLFHLLFNFSTILVGLLVFSYFIDLVELFSLGSGIDNHIANAHMLFNICGVVLFLPFVGLAKRGLDRLLPDKL